MSDPEINLVADAFDRAVTQYANDVVRGLSLSSAAVGKIRRRMHASMDRLFITLEECSAYQARGAKVIPIRRSGDGPLIPEKKT